MFILYRKLLKCYYGNIASISDLRVLHMYQRKKQDFMKIFINK